MSIKVGLVAILLFVLVFSFVAKQAFAFDRLYERTPVGTIEVKELPARKALATASDGSYFQRDDRLFMTLFDFIKENDIAMTVPVEAEIDNAEMRFFVGQDQETNPVESSESVWVADVPPQTVVSVGLRGAYSQDVFTRGQQELKTWLAANPNWRALAEPYAVYWDGPYMPVPLRRSEVHILIARVTS